MAIIKCKMCGGDMELSADKSYGTCAETLETFPLKTTLGTWATL